MITAYIGTIPPWNRPKMPVIIRDYMPPREAGVRIGVVMSATVFG
ncbi:MAG: MFS transporter, partial [Hyphomicrobiales bacterium]